MFGWCSWLSRQSNTLKVPSSILGSNMIFVRDTSEIIELGSVREYCRQAAKITPRVRLELTTYRLTAGRAANCAIQE
jgi:hypothetical protein